MNPSEWCPRTSWSNASPLAPRLSSYLSILVAFFHVGEQWFKWLYWISLMGSQMKPVWAWEVNWFVLRIMTYVAPPAVHSMICTVSNGTRGGGGKYAKLAGKRSSKKGNGVSHAPRCVGAFHFSRWEFFYMQNEHSILFMHNGRRGWKGEMYGPTTPPCGRPPQNHFLK